MALDALISYLIRYPYGYGYQSPELWFVDPWFVLRMAWVGMIRMFGFVYPARARRRTRAGYCTRVRTAGRMPRAREFARARVADARARENARGHDGGVRTFVRLAGMIYCDTPNDLRLFKPHCVSPGLI